MVAETDLAKVKRDLKGFKMKIRESGWKDARCVLFGSWAKGKQRPESDIDVCIISKYIKDRFDDKMKMLSISNEYNIMIEPVVMLPEDLEDKYYTLANEVKKWGVEI